MSINSDRIHSYVFDGHPLSDYLGKPFPFHALPVGMQDYVAYISDVHRVDPSAVALACLTLLGNTLAHSTFMPAVDGHHNSTRLLTCISASNPRALFLAIESMLAPMLAIQLQRLKEASLRSEDDYRAMRDEPYYPSAWGSDRLQEEREKERAQKIVALKYPMFVARNPSVTELKKCIARSFDHSMSVVSDCLLDELRFPSDAGQSKQREIYCSLAQEGLIELPSRSRRSSQRLMQSHVGILMTGSREALDHAVNLPLGVVVEILGRGTLYHAVDDHHFSSDPGMRGNPESWWVEAIESCLLTRRSPHRRPEFRAYDYDKRIESWRRILLEGDYFQSLFSWHMPLFLDLPRRVAATLLISPERLLDSGDWPFEIAKWMMAQTLLVTVPAQWQSPIHSLRTPEKIMLDKIQKMQPVKFWKLRRTYNQQSRQRHEHVLAVLLKQGLVRYNDNQELEVIP